MKATVLVLGAWFGVLAAIGEANWGLGWLRALLLAVLSAALWWAADRRIVASRPALLVLLVGALVALAAQTPWRETQAHPPIDIGATTIHAARVQAEGVSLYDTVIDEGAPEGFRGYKYGPLTAAFYRPFLALCGEPRGLYVGNFVLLMLTALASALLAARIAGCEAALAAAAATLLPHFVGRELLHQGVTDLVAVAPAVLALYFALSRRRFLAGLCLGVSLSAKILPGALVAVPILVMIFSPAVVVGVIAGLAPLLAEVWRAPQAALANLLVFNLSRPADSTSLAFFLPSIAVPCLVLIALAVIAAVSWRVRTMSPRALLAAHVAMLGTFLVCGKIIHRNYLLWWIPFAAAALGVLFEEARDAP